MGWGGSRKGAGRKLSPLKTEKLAADLIARGQLLLGHDDAPTPLDFILQQLWNKENPFEIRFDAAKTALPFCSPKLQAVAVKNMNAEDDKITIVIKDLSKPQPRIESKPSFALTDAQIVETVTADAEESDA